MNVVKKPVFENEKENEGKGPTQVSFPSALIDLSKKNVISKKETQREELWEIFKKVKVNIPLLEAIKQVPAFAKSLKELCTQKRKQKVPKRVDLTERVSWWRT